MSKKHNAVIFAHPDDESLFFSGLILTERARPWTLVCVTDGNADGAARMRFQQLKQAAKKLGVKRLIQLNLPDRFHSRLSQVLLQKKLNELPQFHEIYTHGPLGEYGHPHHQDVCFAVHEVFHKKNKIYSIAYNALGDKIINLSKQQFLIKAKILAEIYYSETKKLIHFLPSHQQENFLQLTHSEVREIYSYFTTRKKLQTHKLHAYRWYTPFMLEHKQLSRTRPF